MYTPSRRLRAASAACAVALLVAGCASDDEPLSSPSEPTASATPTPTAASIDDFCQAKLAVDAADLAGGPPDDEPATPSAAQIAEKKAKLTDLYTAPYAELERTAQSAVAADVATVAGAVKAGIDNANSDFGEDPSFGAAEAKIDKFLLDNCGYTQISGTAADYEYSGLPDVAVSGPNALTLTNEGEEFHEMLLLRINDDVDLTAKQLLALPEAEGMSKSVPAGITFSAPGETGTSFFDLKPGRYVIACFIPKGLKPGSPPPEDAPPHFTLGMVADLKVLEPGQSAAPSTAEPTGAGSGSSATQSPDPSSGTSSHPSSGTSSHPPSETGSEASTEPTPY